MSQTKACAVATFMLLQSGCALFGLNEEKPSTVKSVFPAFQSSAETEEDSGLVLRMVRLEASIVSRPANDPKIRRYIWEELDESGLMSPDLRQRLNACGFRIGVAGSATPWALQSLARDAVAAHRSGSEQELAESSQQTSDQPVAVGPAFSLMANGKSLLEVQGQLDAQKLPLNQIPELASIRDRTGLRCVIAVTVKELSNDWVLLNILPQIHVGNATPRLSISGLSDQLPVRQSVVSLYEHQFEVKLLTGEVAVIARHESDDWNLGRLFFQPESGSSATERVLMIRMAGVDRLKGQSDPSFRLAEYGN